MTPTGQPARRSASATARRTSSGARSNAFSVSSTVVALAHEPEQDVLGADEVVPSAIASRSESSSTFLLSRANRVRPLRHGPPRVEVALDPADDLVEVDAEQLERLGVLGVEAVGVPRGRGRGPPADLVARRPELGQHPHGEHTVGRDQRLEQVRRAHLRSPGAGGDLLGSDDHRASIAGEPLHLDSSPPRLPAGVLLVDGLPADPEHIGDLRHDQPAARARSTWLRSRCSSSRPRARTARSPARGSAAVAASVSSLSSYAVNRS